jgi:hypothetical protein
MEKMKIVMQAGKPRRDDSRSTSGVCTLVSWQRLTGVLQTAGIITETETVSLFDVTEQGINIVIEPSV